MRTQRKPDHGAFRVPQTQDEQDALVRLLIDEARTNPLRPGHAWRRMAVEQNGAPVARKDFHVALDEKIVEIWETWNDVETARRTYDLNDRPN